MAHLHPTGWQEMSATGAAAREIETLAYLNATLAESPYHIYHGVHWTNVEKGYSVFDEVDFVIVAPNGRMLLIEQIAGFLNETPDGLVKQYAGKPRRVAQHIMRSIRVLTERFGGELSIDYVLYCPDFIVREPKLAGLDPRHIIDSTNKHRLAQMVRDLLPVSDPKPDAQFDKVSRFLGNMLSLRPDPSAMIGNAARMVARLSGGLATWAHRLEFSPFRLRVVGTAGSGKTQLALTEYTAAIEAGLCPLYVCYNRPLADHIQTLVPDGGRVTSFHMLSDAFAREQGDTPNYAAPDVWDKIEAQMAASPLAASYDVLIVDEGQDFSPVWRDILLRMLKPDGRAIWLEDPNQNLYGKESVPLPGWVTLHSDTNYRSPRQIVDLLATIGATQSPVEAGSPFKGADIEELVYPDGDTEAMLAQTRRAVTLCLGAGFTREDIAIASFRGREKSTILHLDQLSEVHTLKSFTGEYDLFGNPQYRDGGLLAESVYRFKGQSAPAIIFTEIDFEEMDQLVLRKLFVGMTRARLKLVLVLSDRAEQQILERIG